MQGLPRVRGIYLLTTSRAPGPWSAARRTPSRAKTIGDRYGASSVCALTTGVGPVSFTFSHPRPPTRCSVTDRMARVLVIDDDRAVVAGASDSAVRSWSRSDRRGHRAKRDCPKSRLTEPEVVLLDLGLPDLDGLEVCHRIRRWSAVPIIVLSATGLESRKVAALDGGANDYVTKPFGMRNWRRESGRRSATADPTQGPQSDRLVVGEIELDLVHHQAICNGERMELTSREFDLLAYLARTCRQGVHAPDDPRECLGRAYGGEAEYLRVYVYRLRRKLGDAGGCFTPRPGIGYSLLVD